MKIVPFDTVYVDFNGDVHNSGYSGSDDALQSEFYIIPCGKCIGCRQDMSKEWSNRLMMEMLYHDSSYFVTLTYNDDNIPLVYDPLTGEVNGFYTLCKEDVQLFMKRLRKWSAPDKLRFYLAGEYGPRTARPHYHAIIFGLHLPIDDLRPCGRSETGNQYYVSGVIERLWNKGFVSVEPANYYTCKYVSAYVTKKIGNKPDEIYTSRGMVPPFSLSSRRPGIGYQFFEDHPEILEHDEIFLSTPIGSIKCGIPKYFKKKIRENYPELAEERSRSAIARAEHVQELIEDRISKPYLDYLHDCEVNHLKRAKRRDKI